MNKVEVAAVIVGVGLLFALAKIVAAKPPPEGEVKVIKVGIKE